MPEISAAEPRDYHFVTSSSSPRSILPFKLNLFSHLPSLKYKGLTQAGQWFPWMSSKQIHLVHDILAPANIDHVLRDPRLMPFYDESYPVE